MGGVVKGSHFRKGLGGGRGKSKQQKAIESTLCVVPLLIMGEGRSLLGSNSVILRCQGEKGKKKKGAVNTDLRGLILIEKNYLGIFHSEQGGRYELQFGFCWGIDFQWGEHTSRLRSQL